MRQRAQSAEGTPLRAIRKEVEFPTFSSSSVEVKKMSFSAA